MARHGASPQYNAMHVKDSRVKAATAAPYQAVQRRTGSGVKKNL